MTNYIEQAIENVAKINQTRRYWFIRTQGGDYYSDFLTNGFVAIGYDNASHEEIRASYKSGGDYNVSTLVESKYPDETRPKYIATQLIDFSINIKKGDIIIIPSQSSNYLSFGEIIDSLVVAPKKLSVQTEVDYEICEFKKRRKVKWYRTNISIDSLDANFLRIKTIQRTVTELKDGLIVYVDRAIIPLFIKGEQAHVALVTTKTGDYSASATFESWTEVLNLMEEFALEEGIDVKKESIKFRINVQSPGDIELISSVVIGILLISGIIAIAVGVDIQLKDSPFLRSIKTKFDRVPAKVKNKIINGINGLGLSKNNIREITNQLKDENNDNSQNK
jgi:restriction system protein